MKSIKQPLLNARVNSLTLAEVQAEIRRAIREKRPMYIVEVNTDVLVKMEKDAFLRQIADQAALTLVDGKPLIWLSRLLKRPVKEKISGADLALTLCRAAPETGDRIFLLGGKEGVARQARENLEKSYPGITIAGEYAPPFGFENDEEELARIRAIVKNAHPDVVLACFGCPKQEKWVYDNYRRVGASVCLCAGATVDFLAGQVRRAPRWMSDAGLEWFYRFLKEPRRLFRRYFVEDLRILKLIFKYR
ncbi:MAG: WecB/TagA/CpsF family glycosyltransferase [Clostridia bacterium]|nr:WecB/TagA/CpsF family glycosyltransferase [Clostridia bacterium]